MQSVCKAVRSCSSCDEEGARRERERGRTRGERRGPEDSDAPVEGPRVPDREMGDLEGAREDTSAEGKVRLSGASWPLARVVCQGRRSAGWQSPVPWACTDGACGRSLCDTPTMEHQQLSSRRTTAKPARSSRTASPPHLESAVEDSLSLSLSPSFRSFLELRTSLAVSRRGHTDASHRRAYPYGVYPRCETLDQEGEGEMEGRSRRADSLREKLGFLREER